LVGVFRIHGLNHQQHGFKPETNKPDNIYVNIGSESHGTRNNQSNQSHDLRLQEPPSYERSRDKCSDWSPIRSRERSCVVGKRILYDIIGTQSSSSQPKTAYDSISEVVRRQSHGKTHTPSKSDLTGLLSPPVYKPRNCNPSGKPSPAKHLTSGFIATFPPNGNITLNDNDHNLYSESNGSVGHLETLPTDPISYEARRAMSMLQESTKVKRRKSCIILCGGSRESVLSDSNSVSLNQFRVSRIDISSNSSVVGMSRRSGRTVSSGYVSQVSQV